MSPRSPGKTDLVKVGMVSSFSTAWYDRDHRLSLADLFSDDPGYRRFVWSQRRRFSRQNVARRMLAHIRERDDKKYDRDTAIEELAILLGEDVNRITQLLRRSKHAFKQR
jgi:hypothetical protein